MSEVHLNNSYTSKPVKSPQVKVSGEPHQAQDTIPPGNRFQPDQPPTCQFLPFGTVTEECTDEIPPQKSETSSARGWFTKQAARAGVFLLRMTFKKGSNQFSSPTLVTEPTAPAVDECTAEEDCNE